MAKRKSNAEPERKPRPKTGEPRKTRQPLKIDKLPESVQDAILTLRNGKGLTWDRLEERSMKPYSAAWEKDGGGFIDWTAIELDVLELFPDLKLPAETLRRWYDIRIEQARADVLHDGDAAAKFVEQLGKLGIDGMNEAVQNTMVREVFSLIRSTGDGDKFRTIGVLKDVSMVLARLQKVKLQQDQVSVEQRKIKILEDREQATMRKLEAETTKLTKKAAKGEVTPADVDRLRERVFGLPPKKRAQSEAA